MGGQSHQSQVDTSGPMCVPETNHTPASGGQGNSARQDDLGLSTPGSDLCEPDAVVLPKAVAANGDLSYYRSRHDDFGSRYSACGLTPPVYYLDYGMLYVSRFTFETAPRLTPEGQGWLDRARVNLQTAIENRRAADPAAFDQLEKNNAAFTAFAYGTHSDAYWDAGLGDLNIFDLGIIGLTPDVEDLVAFEGLEQVVDIGGRLVSVWGEDGIDYVGGDGTTEELVEGAYQGLVVVGDEIDEAFGQGTTAVLLERAEELGADAHALAEDAHGVAAEAVGMGADAIDSLAYDGATSDGVNWAREQGQDVVDGAEAGVNWLSDTWDDIDLF